MKPKNHAIAPLALEKFVSQNTEDRFQSGRKIINANQIANIYLQENVFFLNAIQMYQGLNMVRSVQRASVSERNGRNGASGVNVLVTVL